MTEFEDILETILEEYARRDSEGEFDTWEKTDAFVKEKAEVLLAYAKEEHVSENLEEAAMMHFKDAMEYEIKTGLKMAHMTSFKAGAKWQKEQMMAKAVDGEVTYGKSLAIPSLGFVLDKEGFDFGDKVKVIVIKEG